MPDIVFREKHIRAFDGVHQDIWHEGQCREYWLYGGRGSTKSSYISLEIILGMLADPEANAICFRRVGNTLRDSVYTQLLWAIDTLGVTAYFRAGKAPLEIERISTGQRILFRGADDPMKSKSIKLKKGYFRFLWFEELAEFRGMEDIRMIEQSVLRGERQGIVFCSYNPPRSAQNWVNKEALVRMPHRMNVKTTYLDVPESWLGRDFCLRAEALKEVNERAYRNEYLGEVTGSGGMVFENLALRSITREEAESGKICRGLDFGFAVDPDAYTEWAYDRKNARLYALHEFYGKGNNIETLSARVKERAGTGVVWCDSAEPRLIKELRARGVNAIPVKKGKGSIESGIRLLQNLREIVIDPKETPEIAREFSLYAYERDKAGEFISEYPDKNNHTIDSARYALESSERAAKTLS